MNEYLKAQIQTYCEMVNIGKPSALMPIKIEYIKEAQEIIKKENLKIYPIELSQGWVSLWIYKDDYLLEIIKKMPEHPKTAYDHWVLGKIFGYSDQAIKEFIKTKLL